MGMVNVKRADSWTSVERIELMAVFEVVPIARPAGGLAKRITLSPRTGASGRWSERRCAAPTP